MRELTIRELLDLITADVANPEDRVQRMYEWHFERAMSAIRFIFGVAASLLIAMLVALLQKETTDDYPDGLIEAGMVAATVTGLYGSYRFWELRLIHRTYAASLQLLGELKQLRAFAIRYRESR